MARGFQWIVLKRMNQNQSKVWNHLHDRQIDYDTGLPLEHGTRRKNL